MLDDPEKCSLTTVPGSPLPAPSASSERTRTSSGRDISVTEAPTGWPFMATSTRRPATSIPFAVTSPGSSFIEPTKRATNAVAGGW